MRALRKILISLTTLAVGLILVEAGNRLRLSVSGTPYESGATRAYLEREVERIGQSGASTATPKGNQKAPSTAAHKVLHPYTGFDIRPSIKNTANNIAYFKSKKSELTFDVLLFGGSVANGLGVDAGDVLLEALKEDPRFTGRPMRLLRYARASFKQPQQVISLAYLLSCGFRPDAVINLDGFNEVAVANTNAHFKINPLQPSISQWGPHVQERSLESELTPGLINLHLLRQEITGLAEQALQSNLLWSSLVGNFYLGRISAGRNRQAQLQKDLLKGLAAGPTKGLGGLRENAVIRGPDWNRELEEVMNLCVGAWREGSVSMDAMCKRRSIFYLHALQPTLHSPGAKVATPEEIKTGRATKQWMEGAQIGYPKLRTAGKRLSASGIAFFDASQVFSEVTETLYYDACHFSKKGQEILAKEIARAFLDHYPTDLNSR